MRNQVINADDISAGTVYEHDAAKEYNIKLCWLKKNQNDKVLMTLDLTELSLSL